MKRLKIIALAFLVFSAGMLSACSSNTVSADSDTAAEVSVPSSDEKDPSDIIISTDESLPESSSADETSKKKQPKPEKTESTSEESQKVPGTEESSQEVSDTEEVSQEVSDTEESSEDVSEEVSDTEESSDEESQESSDTSSGTDTSSLTVKDVAGSYHMVIDDKAYSTLMNQGGTSSLSYKKIAAFLGREFAMSAINKMSGANVYTFFEDGTRNSALNIEKAKECEKNIYSRIMDAAKKKTIDEAAELLGVDAKNIKRAIDSDPSQSWETYCDILKKQLLASIDKRYSEQNIAEQYPGSKTENGMIIVNSGTYRIENDKVITDGQSGTFELEYHDGFLEFTGAFKSGEATDDIKIGMMLKKDA